MSDAHFLGMEDFTAALLGDSFSATQSYVQVLVKHNHSFLIAGSKQKVGYPKSYPIVVWNYLPPSAGSIIHPHVQIIIEGNSLFLSRLFCINPPFIS